jgi:hypothetical protein
MHEPSRPALFKSESLRSILCQDGIKPHRIGTIKHSLSVIIKTGIVVVGAILNDLPNSKVKFAEKYSARFLGDVYMVYLPHTTISSHT